MSIKTKKFSNVEEIFGNPPPDPNADNFTLARYITFAHGETNYAIRSTDFRRAEKALSALKNNLPADKYTFGINLYPIDFDADEITPVYHTAELDGSEEDSDRDDVFSLLPDFEFEETIDYLQDMDEQLQLIDEKYSRLPVESEIKIGDEVVTYLDGQFLNVVNFKYGGAFERRNDGTVAYWTLEHRGEAITTLDRWDEEDFFGFMEERGACVIGEPPTDDFATELTRLQTELDAAYKQKKVAQAALDTAADKERQARRALEKYLDRQTEALRDRIHDAFNGREISLYIGNQKGTRIHEIAAHDARQRIMPSGRVYEDTTCKFFILGDYDALACYDTFEQLTAAVDIFIAAIKSDNWNFDFPTVEQLNPTVQEVAAKCARINSNAPADWSVYYDSERGDFAVEYKERRVGSLTAYQLVAARARGFFDKYAA